MKQKGKKRCDGRSQWKTNAKGRKIKENIKWKGIEWKIDDEENKKSMKKIIEKKENENKI